EVRVGHDHDMPVGIRIFIKNDVAVGAAVDDLSRLVVFFGGIAEYAARLLVGAGDIGVTPGSPEEIHGARVAERRCELRAPSSERKRQSNGSLGARGSKLAAHECDESVNFPPVSGIGFDTVRTRLL